MSSQYKTIVIKIGTNVLTTEKGLLDSIVLEDLTKQIVELKRDRVDVILVTSGAMGAGRALVKLEGKTPEVEKRQILASVGQPQLMRAYLEAFQQHKTLCAQVLATKEDFRDRQHYLNMKRCFEALLRDGIVPIVNENDVVAVSELMFTDNDELAGLIAAMMNVDLLLILTNVEGVLDAEGKVISAVEADTKLPQAITTERSSFGRGGMLTKCKVARRLAGLGITTYIVNGKRKNILSEVVNGQKVGTRFGAAKRASSVKKWIATAPGCEKGIVTINAGAVGALTRSEQATSLLPVGIVKIDGNFEKGDLLKIQDERGKLVGVGLAQYGAEIARESIGTHGKKPLIHYDYLSLEV